MDHLSEKRYPVDAKDYKLYEEVGEGVSATVYRALCISFNEVVAIKVLDLERCNNDLDGIRREVQTMSLIHHPNVLRAYCSFTAGHNLWVVMPYMSAGSCLHIMKSSYPEGFDEPVIATVLYATLKALVYLHAHGQIHRDVKAGNILIGSNGAVKLADFGVSAGMFDTGDRQRSRNTFVGTPCWMAPEVMQQLHGYDFKADIWSFGITALELAHGHAPFSKYPPMKVLLMTLQNAPPGLDYERDKKFSKSFKELVAACLVKDPKKRPTSEKLLKHTFFKHARSNDYLVHTILNGLPPLGERFRVLKDKEADLLMQNMDLNGDKEHMSQQEYMRGISAWNFNLEDLKHQASLIPDDYNYSNAESKDGSNDKERHYDDIQPAGLSPDRSVDFNATTSHEDGLDDLESLEGTLASFPIQPIKALKGFFDIDGDDVNANVPSAKSSPPSDAELSLSPEAEMRQNRSNDDGSVGRSSSLPLHVFHGKKNTHSGPLFQGHVSASKKLIGVGERDNVHGLQQSDRNYSGTFLHHQKRDTNHHASAEDLTDGAVVQRKGRFKVTSADLSAKNTANCSNPAPTTSAASATSATPVTSASPETLNPCAVALLPSLQWILQQNSMQRKEIMKLIEHVEQSPALEGGSNVNSQISGKEAELFARVIQLQQRIGSLVEELQTQKLKNYELERQLNLL
ncbi:Serine/threonine-protein kinase fray2-like protein [Drosera capensis]